MATTFQSVNKYEFLVKLPKTKITKMTIFSDEWRQFRIGKFTASNIYKIMGDRGLGEQGKTYIMTKVAEELSDQSLEEEINTAAIQWGREQEPKAIKAFMEEQNCEMLVTQQLIWQPDSRFACTPDFLKLVQETSDGKHYVVHTGEVKCFQPVHHAKMCACDSAKEILEADPKVFWQVVMQMDECGAALGYAVFYNPTFRFSKLKIVPFKRMELATEFSFLKERQTAAMQIFLTKRDKLITQ